MSIKHYHYLIAVLLYTLSIGLALFVSAGIEQLVLTNTQFSSAFGQLIFAVIFPVVLVIQFFAFRRWLDKYQTIDTANKLYRPSFASSTLNSRHAFQGQLQEYLMSTYGVNKLTLFTLDWQQNIYLCMHHSKLPPIQLSHAAVKYAEYNRVPFSTERAMDRISDLTDMQLAELVTFMSRHKFVLMVPLYAHHEVYGFIFFTLDQIKDSKLFALKSFDELQLVSERYGSLLQKILIYDAIVLSNSNV